MVDVGSVAVALAVVESVESEPKLVSLAEAVALEVWVTAAVEDAEPEPEPFVALSVSLSTTTQALTRKIRENESGL